MKLTYGVKKHLIQDKPQQKNIPNNNFYTSKLSFFHLEYNTILLLNLNIVTEISGAKKNSLSDIDSNFLFII